MRFPNQCPPGANIGNMNTQYNAFNPPAAVKMVDVNRMTGSNMMSQNQGTTRNIYDTLPIDGRTVFRFFENAGARQFPRTNLTEGRLPVAQSLAVQEIYLAVVTFDAMTDALTDITSVPVAGAGFEPISGGEFSLYFEQSEVITRFAASSLMPDFNGAGLNQLSCIYRFRTNLIIPELINFRLELRTSTLALVANTELRVVLQGHGAVMSPRGTF